MMIGPVNPKFFLRDMLSETGSSMKEAGLNSPMNSALKETLIQVGVAGSYPLKVSSINYNTGQR